MRIGISILFLFQWGNITSDGRMQSVKIEDFPWTVIESPGRRFHEQNMAAMRVLSLGKGGEGYKGPARVCPERWKHTAAFYILDPVESGIYMTTSLNDRFHYQVLQSEAHIIEEIESHCRKLGNKAPVLKRIKGGENYDDENIVVIHDPPAHIKEAIDSFDDSTLIERLLSEGRFDANRGNTYIDTGFASAKSQARDKECCNISLPVTLKHTKEPAFVQSMVRISMVTDMVCKEYNWLECFRVEGIEQEWAHQIHPKNLLQSSRHSLSLPSSAFLPHMDTQNDPRPLMSTVPVIHRIVNTVHGPMRHAKIGYSRKACYEAGVRRDLLMPVITKVSNWYHGLSSTRTLVNNDLFHPCDKRKIVKDREWLTLPVHCCKTVGLSTYIDSIARLQTEFSFSRYQCVALAYSVLASESPYHYWKTAIDLIAMSVAEKEEIGRMQAVDLGFYFQQKVMQAIASGDAIRLPRRHQPHYNKPPSDENVKVSIVNLIKLANAMMNVSEEHRHKEYYHSKGLAIVIQSTDKGGCHGAGPLTGQSLLHVLSILGLIPVQLSYWGEIAILPAFLKDSGITGAKADQFLSTLSAHLDVSLADAEHIVCKYGRTYAGSQEKFQDTVMLGQGVYSVMSNGLLTVYDGSRSRTIFPPCQHLVALDESTRVNPDFWMVSTKGRVKGGNRLPRRKKTTTTVDPDFDEINRTLPIPRELHHLADHHPLYLNVTSVKKFCRGRI